MVPGSSLCCVMLLSSGFMLERLSHQRKLWLGLSCPVWEGREWRSPALNHSPPPFCWHWEVCKDHFATPLFSQECFPNTNIFGPCSLRVFQFGINQAKWAEHLLVPYPLGLLNMQAVFSYTRTTTAQSKGFTKIAGLVQRIFWKLEPSGQEAMGHGCREERGPWEGGIGQSNGNP